ncbi:4-hydroxyphenylpyruvate dioxygenase [Kitasatospora sp. NPDC088391]|uniref:4-hydroxyphenylpyruvate dioxygenase n=1 Tax=Kitasatospora sp. NPDC088391 TaxID=3364074 RepID=UPI0037F7D62D
MNVLGVDHVEFQVGDARQAAYVLSAGLGFRPLGQGGPESGLPGRRSLLLGQGAARVLLTSGLVPDDPASRYVARHGDGVAVLAFAVADAVAAFGAAVAGGARPVAAPVAHPDGSVTALVSGFGDVLHRLVERPAGAGFLPGVVESAAPDGSGPEQVRGIDHAAVCLPAGELAATAGFYRRAFGFEVVFEEYVAVADQGMFSQVVQSPGGGATLTLVAPDPARAPGQIDDFLSWHGGAGVQHLALDCADVAAAVDAMAARGIGFAPTPDAYYDTLPGVVPERLRRRGILLDRDHWGELYQIFATSMHLRRTFFWELIERHGARTFGTGNIPALYEAKERELAAVRVQAQAVAR